MTEIALHQPTTDLSQQMDYAQAVAGGSLLPDAYRNKPANVLIAVGLGSAMGLSPAESLYRIDVIQGRPTASAELIAANVRKAGHKLRVRGDNESATAQIIRADDPDYTFEVTRDMAWARSMGLASRDQYKKQPGTMLQYRAITAVARLACPEALYGVAYTADEMYDAGASPAAPQQGAGLGAALAAQQQTTSPDAEPITPSQVKKIAAAMGDLDLKDRAVALAYVNDVIGREVGSRNELTKAEASDVIEALQRDIDERNAASADVETGEIVEAELLPDPTDGSDPWANGGNA